MNNFTKRTFCLIISFFLLNTSANITLTNAKTDVTFEIAEPFSIDRTWEDVNLLLEDDFHNYTETVAEVTRFQELVPELIDLEVIGESYHNKPIHSLRITNEEITTQKAKTLVVAHHHGREQITVETALRFIVYLINGYGVDDDITEYINTQEIFIIPTLNPDALDLVIEEEDYWLRKNLRPYDDDGDGLIDEDYYEDVDGDGIISSFDVYEKDEFDNPVYLYSYYEGIDNDGDGLINEDPRGHTDLNRNYDSYWRTGQSWSPETTSQIFPGVTPFSEPETQTFRDFTINHKFAMAYSLHSGINATFFADGDAGFTEPTLYWNMINDYRDILPHSYTDIYYDPTPEKQKLSSALAGGWDTWMYFEQDTLAPITFEIYRNATSLDPALEPVFVDNSTHLIKEWYGIYGFFTPDKNFIDDLWIDVKPAFDYLLEMTPRLEVDTFVVDEETSTDEELSIGFNCTNLSPRLKSIHRV
ncbi:MAG: hypothetical protein KAR35_05455, partial [Candidatus Heimdallarchaeota archaeon]|nr:hypothetical protein [Candidatus Heimdallarchaeota archaeon]MCK5048804.1 hypothetical protein [Candidatus Heimdallarchaeota archaeon]